MKVKELKELLNTKNEDSVVFFVSRDSVSELHAGDVMDFDASKLNLTHPNEVDEIFKNGVFLFE
jgi:hypothetical protein